MEGDAGRYAGGVLEDLRWFDGVRCPRWDPGEVDGIRSGNQYQSEHCEHRFSVTAGTILDNTNLPLWKWFVAIDLMDESKMSISAAQVGRIIDVSYPDRLAPLPRHTRGV